MDLTFKDHHTYNGYDDQNGSENTEEQIQTPDRAGVFVILFHHDSYGFSCFCKNEQIFVNTATISVKIL